MTPDELASVTLEHLRHIRSRVDQIAEDVTDLKSAMVLVKREINHGDETAARQQFVMDKLAARIERIERRLEISDTR